MHVNESQDGVGGHIQSHSEAHAGGHTVGDFPDQVNRNPHPLLEQKQENSPRPVAGDGIGDAYPEGQTNQEQPVLSSAAMQIPNNASDGNQDAEGTVRHNTLNTAVQAVGAAPPCDMSNETVVQQGPVNMGFSPGQSLELNAHLSRSPYDEDPASVCQNTDEKLGNEHTNSERFHFYPRALSWSSQEGPSAPAQSTHKRLRSK